MNRKTKEEATTSKRRRVSWQKTSRTKKKSEEDSDTTLSTDDGWDSSKDDSSEEDSDGDEGDDEQLDAFLDRKVVSASGGSCLCEAAKALYVASQNKKLLAVFNRAQTLGYNFEHVNLDEPAAILFRADVPLQLRQASFLPVGERGVFAQSCIPVGAVIAEYNGARTTTKPPDSHKYVFQPVPDKDYYIDAQDDDPTNIARYVNDPRGTGFRPNTCFLATGTVAKRGVEFRPHVWLVATRAICPGEELLAPYGVTYWEGDDAPPGAPPVKDTVFL